ncbi:MAG: hypothetical protein HC875_38025 [Anaerolineales bacterium]|nr:hypothetical protein [Anaerolineales bacterium]
MQRQQAVLFAIKTKALQMNAVLQLPELWQSLGQTVQTDLSLSQALQLAQLAYQIDPAHIQTAAISHDQTMSFRTAKGASVLLPKRAEIETLVESMFGPVTPNRPAHPGRNRSLPGPAQCYRPGTAAGLNSALKEIDASRPKQ